jgi:secondary thiamine-phosphate synthase enzyme
MKTKEFTLHTARQGYQNITNTVRNVIAESGVQSGICVVFCPHTTAAITINENADPDVQHDLEIGFDEAFPDRRVFQHSEGNSDAHLKCSAVGASETILIEDGKPLLGMWQGIYFCEFDGPRTRRYYVKVMADG